jgi:hypothetical protein
VNNSSARNIRRGLITAVLSAAGAVTGLVIAIVVTLNLHIFAGVENGYLATPAQVLERSAWILAVDVAILVAAPLLALVLVVRLRRRRPPGRAPAFASRTHGARTVAPDADVGVGTTPCGPPPSSARPDSGDLPRFVSVQPEDVVDVFVYVVVLNLAIEYLPAVISESFTLSLLTAALLKLSLELVLVAKARAMARLRGAMTVRAKLTAALLLWVTAAGSKVVVLELVNVAFGDAVSLGGFVSVTLLVVTLLLARAAVRRLLSSGRDDTAGFAETEPTRAP